MAVKIIFNGTENSKTDDHQMQMSATYSNEIYIGIEIPSVSDSFIILDKETAIKFSKELRKQIAIISENEVKNV